MDKSWSNLNFVGMLHFSSMLILRDKTRYVPFVHITKYLPHDENMKVYFAFLLSLERWKHLKGIEYRGFPTLKNVETA